MNSMINAIHGSENNQWIPISISFLLYLVSYSTFLYKEELLYISLKLWWIQKLDSPKTKMCSTISLGEKKIKKFKKKNSEVHQAFVHKPLDFRFR